jgi:hypothetical protein
VIHLCTLKYGTLYSSGNVNRLYESVKTFPDVKVFCLTEDPSGLNENIIVIPLNENPELKKHWNKLRFLDPSFTGASSEDDIIIMDIDQVFIRDASPIIYKQVNHGEVCFAERWWTHQKYGCPISGGLFKFKADGSHKYVLDMFLEKPDYWLLFFYNAYKQGKYPEKMRKYAGEQNFLHANFKKSHNLIYWNKDYIVKLLDEPDFIERQKLLYKYKVGGELIVNGKFNPNTILVTFAGIGNDIFSHELI